LSTSSKRTTRWTRARLIAAAAGAGALAAPSLLSSVAYAGTPAPAPVKAKVSVLQDEWGDSKTDAVSKGSDGAYRPEQDPGSLWTVTKAVGARDVWSQKDAAGRAITGQGVTVALLDSGVAPVPGLNGWGKLIQGPDLSLENNSASLQGLDTFGHGTHLAGIIAGADPTTRDLSGGPQGTTPTQELGVAPGAKVLALKLATSNGSTDVSQVIAALDWVSEHAHDNGMNVRVVNLSFGTDSLQPYQIDPLAAAAEHAWKRGLVVVVSGGNEGQAAGMLTDPAIDPYIIAVGASDPDFSVSGWKTPTVADFSSSGTTSRHVDLLAPGRSITSLRDPGSYVDVNHPEGRISGDSTGRLFRGSGTSQAAAVVSGAAALLAQAYPTITPDQVKAALVGTATAVPGVSAIFQGAGELNVGTAMAAARAAAAAKPGTLLATMTTTGQAYPPATGLGSLDAARGGSHLIDPANGVVLAGELDVQGQPFNAANWSANSAAGTAWTGGLWNNARWSGDGWGLSRWASALWESARWSSARWSAADWDSARWSAAGWTSLLWDSARWSSARWSSVWWSSARWSNSAWG
jgi:serine protease AprX